MSGQSENRSAEEDGHWAKMGNQRDTIPDGQVENVKGRLCGNQ